jgi:hypothetical protein
LCHQTSQIRGTTKAASVHLGLVDHLGKTSRILFLDFNGFAYGSVCYLTTRGH